MTKFVMYSALFLCATTCVSAVWHTDIFCEEGEREDSLIYHVGDGWFYHLNSQTEERKYYACVKYRSLQCRGRAIYHVGRGFSHSKEHNGHDRDPDYSEELRLRRNILQRCRELDHLPFWRIFEEERRRFPPNVAARVTLATMRSPMRQARESNFPPIPQTLMGVTEILSNPQYAGLTATYDGADNVFAGAVTDEEGCHHLLLASRRMLFFMSRVDILFSDGTFQIVPSIASLHNRRAQVYNIMTTWRGHTILLASAIMESRTQSAYDALLTLLRNELHQWRFTRVIMDNEAAAINAWEQVFDPHTIQSCLWHICRAFVIELSVLGLCRWFRAPQFPQFTILVRMACALPLLPAPYLRTGWRLLRTEARLRGGQHLRNLLIPFFDYLWRDWVNNDQRRRTMSVYNSMHRTNNICESINSKMLEALGRHPNIFLFFAEFVNLEQTAYTDMLSLHNGQQVSRSRKTRAIVNDQVLIRLWEELRTPPMGINDAVRRFLIEAANRVAGILEAHLRDRL